MGKFLIDIFQPELQSIQEELQQKELDNKLEWKVLGGENF